METKIFENIKFGSIRTGIVNGEPVFCLADVCKILDLPNVTMVKSRLKEDGVSSVEVIDSLGRKQIAAFITESNLYKVIFQSRKPEAEQITDWVTSEVLPSIRKHGMYATSITMDKMISDPDFAIQLLTNLKEERQKRLQAEQTVKEQAPKALFADAVATSTTSCLVGELSKILRQNGIGIGQNRLFEYLRNSGYLCQFGERYNQPTQRSMEMELFEVKKTSINKPDGTIMVTTTTKVTGKGQIYFVNKFLKPDTYGSYNRNPTASGTLTANKEAVIRD